MGLTFRPCWVMALVFAAVSSASAQDQVAWQTSESSPGVLGDVATIAIPPGYLFAPKDQMPTLNRLTGNLDAPGDVGALVPESGEDPWLAFFIWRDIGYVSDEDKDSLDSAAMLETFKENDGPANRQREKQGLSKLTTVGWHVSPFYDPDTNNLTWALTLDSEGSGHLINHNIRVLGRSGVMEVVLVASPESIDGAIDEFTPLLAEFTFNQGQTYAEFVEGDRLAQIGLTGLIVGGGTVLAAKTGLLGMLLKNIKAIGIAVLAALAAIGSRIKAMLSRRAAAAPTEADAP